jgi:hypothetical protein
MNFDAALALRLRMAILTNPKSWRSPTATSSDRVDLSDVEAIAVRRAILFLRVRHGGPKPLAKALRVNAMTVVRALMPKSKPSASLVLRVARLAKVPMDAILAGDWPIEGVCPHCGRG